MKKQYVVLDSEGKPVEGYTVQVEAEEETKEEGFFGKLVKKVKGVNPKTAVKAAAGFAAGVVVGGLGAKALDKHKPEDPIDVSFEADEPFTVESPEVQDLL